MKIKQLLVLCTLVTLISCGKSPLSSTKLANTNDTLSYAFGVNIFYSLQHDSLVLNALAVAKGMDEAKAGKATMNDNAARSFILGFMNKKEMVKQTKEAEINKNLYKRNIQEGDSFLQKNRTQPGVVVTASGLQYKVIKLGKGPKPTANDVVKVHYTGTLINGTKFDSSVDKGQPVQFPVSGVIKGWVEGLQLMPAGSKFMLYIPSELAYGGTGASEMIKPYSTLIFEVELLEIVKK